MATAADVPGKFDVVIDGNGYVFDDSIDPSSVYSSRQRAQFGLSPIFVQRQNVSGDYGDNQQDFFVTFTQRDWSLGEQQRFFRQADEDSKRRYWAGSAVDIRMPGQVSMRAAVTSPAFGATQISCGPAFIIAGNASLMIPVIGTTNLFTVDDTGAVVDRGAHGLGRAPSQWGVTSDIQNVYISSTGGSSVGVRRWNGTVFSTFSASPSDALAFLNNTLYGLRHAAGDLVRYDTAGTLTSIFTWKDSAGNAVGLGQSKLCPLGGKLVILRIPTANASPAVGTGPAELWLYDGGAAPSMIARLPTGFTAYDIAEAQGTIFVSGTMPLASGSGTTTCPVIFYLANGTLGVLWRSYVASTIAPAMVAWGGGLLFTEAGRSALMYWDAAVGGSQTLSTAWLSSGTPSMGASGKFAVAVNAGGNNGFGLPDSGAAASSATITTSLDDFDSSLTKTFHGVRVEFDAATDGNGGTVDVAYRVGDVDGSYTSLATGVASGTEILFSGVSGRSISIKVTLNKGTSTNGPVLKRISLRASPLMSQQYALARYTLALYGTDRAPEPTRVKLRDDTYHTKTGAQMAADLKASAARTTPSTITDEYNGTFTAILNPEDLAVDRIHVGEFRAQLTVRGV